MSFSRLSPPLFNPILSSLSSRTGLKNQRLPLPERCVFRSFSETVQTQSQDQYYYDIQSLPDLSFFQKLYLSFGETIGVLPSKNPRPLLVNSPLESLTAEMRQDPVGFKLLKEKSIISPERFSEFQSYPPNSLGKILSTDLGESIFSSAQTKAKQIHFPSDESYTLSRYVQAHHCLRALFKLPSTEFSEVVLRWFELSQTGFPKTEFEAVFGSLEVAPYHQEKLTNQVIPWALAHARDTPSQVSYISSLKDLKLLPGSTVPRDSRQTPAFFLNIKWEDHLKDDVDQLVEEFGFVRPNF